MEKLLNRLSFFTLLILMGVGVSARTLREMAQSASALLVQKCGLSDMKVSALSQKLKAEVDLKIENLKDSDFKLIEQRAKTCEKDCTCDIYALALEKKQMNINTLNPKAAQISSEQRKVCASRLQKPCSF